MKTCKTFGLIIVSVIFASCEKEQIIPTIADFSIRVINNDYSVPVTVEIQNKSTGADTYEWTFDGSTVTSSTEKNPTALQYLTKGNFKIKLKTSNRDGSTDTKEMDIQIDEAMNADFEWEMQGSDISPVNLQMIDKTKGALNYVWQFEEGVPEQSTEKTPKVQFITAGEHKIKLTITNGRETYSKEKNITVKPAMKVDFD